MIDRLGDTDLPRQASALRWPLQHSKREYGCIILVSTSAHEFFAATSQCIHLRKQMVNHVVFNDAVEKMAPNEAKVAIDCGQRTLDKSPMLSLEVRNIYMGVMQIGNSN